ncbi:MAG: Glu/Leu/Phe/Val dehydrogenase [Anaerolineae bacterium]|nr:Glu/Leu/Phe/Val dehydrogenase [Anaerolineae bacterium]
MTETEYNLFEVAQRQFDHSAELLGLDQPTRELLRVPMREYHFTIPVSMDNGERKIFRGFRIQHNDARGPCKGGIRFHPLQTVDTIRALAMWMTWRAAIVDLPLGGSMGGVICDPHDLSQPEQEKLCRGWVRKISRELGPDVDVPAPDLMTGEQHMMWMLDEYEAIHNIKSPGFITGKPTGLGGSFGKKEATGYGIMITVREALKELGTKPEDTKASFQGFGNVAQNAIRLYQRMGGKVTCVSSWNQQDRTAYAYRKKEGIYLEELLPITNLFGEINRGKAEELGYEVLEGNAWLEQDVDILVPAAIENQITIENVVKIAPSVKLIAEGANGPTTPEAQTELSKRDILIIPDLLANAGGMICSYFEQVQGNMNYYWKKDEVLGKLDTQMTSAYIEVSDFAHKYNFNLRDAVYLIAIERVAKACQARGWV